MALLTLPKRLALCVGVKADEPFGWLAKIVFKMCGG